MSVQISAAGGLRQARAERNWIMNLTPTPAHAKLVEAFELTVEPLT